MANKKGRKPRKSVKLMRKRKGVKSQLKKVAEKIPAAHIGDEYCHTITTNETASHDPQPSTSAHIHYESPDLELTATPENASHKTDFGRRIVNVSQFFSQLQEISSHGPLNCGLTSLEITSETRTGLISLYALSCKMCNMNFQIINDNATDAMDLNLSAVAGTVAIGCGYTQLTDLSAAIGIAPMSKSVFNSKMDLVHKKWEEELIKSMTQAAEEERSLAIEEGRVNSDGVAIIDVIADGCYSKRSYRKNYSALSGAAAIIGRRTNKILYLAIKNKYCSICSVANSKHLDAKEHTCFKNYSGSSTGMESEILLEGFKRSLDMHNLIYGRLISDGDANTYSKILTARPYDKHTVEKIECRNHLLRNMCNKLSSASTETKYLLKYRKYITKKRILSTRKIIIEAVKKYKDTNNVTGLYEDIMVAPEHAFGQHGRCKMYFCAKTGEKDENIEQEFFSNSLWQRIKLIISHIAAHARSLIVDVDSNAVERYHSIVAKLVGGKRINFTQKYQYQMRCNVAALEFNTEKPLSALHKSIVGQSPRNEIKRNQKNKDKLRLLNQKYTRKKKRLFQKEDTRSYGEDCTKPDMAEDMYSKTKQEFLKLLQKDSVERERIARDTILQSGSSEWLQLRRNILTASNFGRVIKRRVDISCQNIVKDILYSKTLDHVSAIKHGRDHEKEALQQLAQQENIIIEPCGLYIDQDTPYFGATPDGLVKDEDMIVEVKCPKSSHNIGFEKAIEDKKIPFYKKNKNSIMINKNHNWYYQVQGQLHITQKEKCLFAIWSGTDFPMKTETIMRDDVFWTQKMFEKLSNFYLDCLLPEIIDPRHTRGMPIRDPAYVTAAIHQKEIKKKSIAEKKRKEDQTEGPPHKRLRKK